MIEKIIKDELYEKCCTLQKMVMKLKENLQQYKRSSYDEANTRVDFIDKFFSLLGWDVHNDSDYAKQYREVVREDKVRSEWQAGKVKKRAVYFSLLFMLSNCIFISSF